MKRALVLFTLLLALPAAADDRRPVKNLRDPDHAAVRLTDLPTPTTVRALTRLPVPPEIVSLYSPQALGARARQRLTGVFVESVVRSAPVETTVWRVTARLVHRQHEPDGDIHLVLADLVEPRVTMIVEIPDPATNPVHAQAWAAARATAEHAKLGTVVTVEGVGFFDYIHRQVGVAENGIELHPVLTLTAPPQKEKLR